MREIFFSAVTRCGMLRARIGVATEHASDMQESRSRLPLEKTREVHGVYGAEFRLRAVRRSENKKMRSGKITACLALVTKQQRNATILRTRDTQSQRERSRVQWILENHDSPSSRPWTLCIVGIESSLCASRARRRAAMDTRFRRSGRCTDGSTAICTCDSA